MTISREVLGRYLKPGMVFIETGTRWGDGCIRAAELGASEIYSVESDFVMKGLAQAHLRDAISPLRFGVYFDHSPKFLRSMTDTDYIDNCVVVLDAHNDHTTPLLAELDAISEWPHKPKAILIDDMETMDYWNVVIEDIYNHLQAIGDYTMIYEDGRREKDILVARYV